MKLRWKSLILAVNWVSISFLTFVAVILSQPSLPSVAQEPAVIIDTSKTQIDDTVTEKKDEESNPKVGTPQKSDSSTNNNQETDEDKGKNREDLEEIKLSPSELARQNKLIEADRLYLTGNISAAEKLYREAKEPFTDTENLEERKAAIVDPTQLSPGGKVYWREAQAGIASQLQTKTLVSLNLLVEKNPEFIPGHIKYAESLKKYGKEKKALEVLERANSLYPDEVDLVKYRVQALAESKKWMEASLAARQFAILNPQAPQAPELKELADKNLKRFKSHIRREVRGNAIANVITGALGYAVTGSLFGPFSALDSTLLLLKGEKSIGESVAKRAKKRLDLVEDKEIVDYVNEIGQKLVKVAGRDEFKYEFFVIPEKSLNAFALPGGKVFIHAGAIAKTNSEAELAGLIGHELSHVVLSHGFQLVTQGNLVSNVTQYLPLGGTFGQILTFNYSRKMEKQADRLGTRLIVASGYAADGLRNLMSTLEKEQKNTPPAWLSSHPAGNKRVRYLEELISESGYNRYAYEGVARHQEIKAKAKQTIKDFEDKKKDKKKRRRENKKKRKLVDQD
ncbi:M48 family metallopeptidase [Mastigocoleus sp. MO_188.B34]|uniref:M48 family metallopeptidase n=1 Tax=Mastigocoleus sp. MO_188.B34 TaxID=3036635 RepID=UPI002606E646|nr:M48 family metallopeptidase [Mastigocoleus sp. MO_188.B34]MDJ0693735.1 M48 family metallopeptidase [Mastigocoleus sp. MO_188.B34]